MGKHDRLQTDATGEANDTDSGGPQTFEEALAFALKGLAESSPGFPPDWLAALSREKDSSSR